jgi:MFS family permease
MLTIVPGIVVMLILARVPAMRTVPSDSLAGSAVIESGRSQVTLPFAFYRAMAVIFLFSLGNASDAFLLLRFADVGVAAFWIPFLWSAIHVVKTASSIAGGRWSDRMGRRQTIALGWLVYAGVYAAFAATSSAAALIIVFLLYGLYFGLTEGVEKAWVADLAPAASRGNAFGIYNAVLGVGSLAASVLFGLIWTRLSPPAAFLTGAGFAVAATALLYLMFSSRHETHSGHQ